MNFSASEFLTALWGAKPPGSVLVWRLHKDNDPRMRPHSRWMRSLKSSPVERVGEPDVYTGVGLASKSYGPKRRCPRHEIVAIPGVWADIDANVLSGPAKRLNCHPTFDDAAETAYLLAEPTILLHSGYGLQAWWLFDGGPWRFRTFGEQRAAAKLAAQWQALLRSRTEHPLDYTHDLARVLRLPNTDNCKCEDAPHPVEVIELGPRHERDDLMEIAAQAGDVNPGYTVATGVHQLAELRAPRNCDFSIAEAMLARSARFAEVWERGRSDLPSRSERDMSLGSMAALAGASDQQIADVITAYRAQHNDPKGLRMDYLQRTVAKIRSGPTT